MRVSRLSKILDDVVLLEQPRLTRKLTGRAMEDEKENNT